MRSSSTLEELMRSQGLRILRNKPYSGGFITQNYGSPTHQRHALQIEINRALYLDERTLERSRGFARDQTHSAPRVRRVACRLARHHATAPAGGRIGPRKKAGVTFVNRPKSREETPRKGMRDVSVSRDLFGSAAAKFQAKKSIEVNYPLQL